MYSFSFNQWISKLSNLLSYHFVNINNCAISLFAFHQVLIIPVITSFGLIFKDKFEALNLTALDATLILNLNSALGMTLGLFNGALLKYFGYRKIGFLGGALFSCGLIFTSCANSFYHFLITYSFVTCENYKLLSTFVSKIQLLTFSHWNGPVFILFFACNEHIFQREKKQSFRHWCYYYRNVGLNGFFAFHDFITPLNHFLAVQFSSLNLLLFC